MSETGNEQPPPIEASSHSVVIVGAGLAGLAAALRLSEHGVAVTLVETRKRLGGRAGSFDDSESGEVLDNCQHVLLRSCTNLLDFYQRLGVDQFLDWHRRLHFAYPSANGEVKRDVMAPDDLPAPLHLIRSLLGFGGLSVRQKYAIARGMLAIMQISQRGRGLYRETSFAQWLEEHHQPAGAIDKFWSLVITSACNETIDRVPANYAIQVFQEGFLYQPEASEMAMPAMALEALYEPAQALIEQAGGKILHGVRGENFIYDQEQQRVTGLRAGDGQELIGDGFVSSVPADRLSKMVTEPMTQADSRLARLDEFETSPIIGIHLFYKPNHGEGQTSQPGSAIMDLPHMVLCESPLQWVFNKGAIQEGPYAGAQHLHAVISAAHEWVDQSPDRIVAMARVEMQRFLPRVSEAQLVHSRVIKEKRATISVRPGIDRFRPDPAGPIQNLYLAGDWTNTRWPATMEGAVRSGYRAAAATIRQLDPNHEPAFQGLQPSLEPSPLYRLLSG